ncbi:hypothetical protein BGW39_010003 [Mortierella sp. 14UC]|nr:hypothetical protein BGW39_010003 [Mortierella sp. 14UC]
MKIITLSTVLADNMASASVYKNDHLSTAASVADNSKREARHHEINGSSGFKRAIDGPQGVNRHENQKKDGGHKKHDEHGLEAHSDGGDDKKGDDAEQEGGEEEKERKGGKKGGDKKDMDNEEIKGDAGDKKGDAGDKKGGDKDPAGNDAAPAAGANDKQATTTPAAGEEDKKGGVTNPNVPRDYASPLWLVQPFGETYVVSWGPNPDPVYAKSLNPKTPIEIRLMQGPSDYLQEIAVLSNGVDSSVHMLEWLVPATVTPATNYSIRMSHAGDVNTYSH